MESISKDYKFDNFHHENNESAFAAALAITQKYEMEYNPLFIYGESCTGKTHLLHAICNHVREQRPSLNVLYITAKDFKDEFLYALQSHKLSSFRKKYSNIDMLLIDDVHLLQDDETITNELFDIFEDHFNNDKQIVFASSLSPNYLTGMPLRLISRFQWGVVVTLRPNK